METRHICYSCHLVRCCGGCCHTCKHPCGMMHDCAIHDNGMSELEGWEWFDNVTRVISAEKVLELDKTAIPLRLQRWAKQLKNVQLKLF